MLSHLLKLVWKRKRSNALIIAEVAVAFTIVFTIATFIISFVQLYNQPLGFEYKNMWNIRLGSIGQSSWQEGKDSKQLKQVINFLKQQPEIEAVQLLRNPTFQNWSSSSSYESNGKALFFNRNMMDDGAPETFGMKLIQGRWFDVQDKGQPYEPVIVNRRFVDEFYPASNPVGENISESKIDGENGNKKLKIERRIVGVFEDFRQRGELNTLSPYVIFRYDLDDGGEIYNVEIKVKEGTTIAYEGKLIGRLISVAPNWRFTVAPWEVTRKQELRETIVPLVLGAIIGAFLIIMVAMGLFGVLWQNIISRTQELGLRRALGATATSVHLQVISELLLITSIGILIATIFLIQLPILGVFQDLTWALFWLGLSSAILFMLLLSVLCAYYPGRLATSYSPAEALHFE